MQTSGYVLFHLLRILLFFDTTTQPATDYSSELATQPSTDNRLPESACGPAALYWAARHLGRPVPLDDLLNKCEDPRGCSIDELCNLAKNEGLFTEVLELRPDQFPNLSVPAIVLRTPKNSEVGHFVLVRGLGGDAFIAAGIEGVQEAKLADLSAETRNGLLPAILISTNPDQLREALASLRPQAPGTAKKPYETILALMILLGAILFSWGIIREKRQRLCRKMEKCRLSESPPA